LLFGGLNRAGGVILGNLRVGSAERVCGVESIVLFSAGVFVQE
jgi:hypothetical protein